MLKVVNAPRRDRVESLLFAANDMRAVRGKDVQVVAIVNDTRREVSPEVLSALQTYEVIAQPWSHRDQIIGQLVA
jgi:hypothetical protein